jgi:hypothetical protein
MDEVAWQLEHSVETDASCSFAWSYLTDVRNWNDPPAEFSLDGPFATGSRGTTLMPGQEPVQWRIRKVQPGQLYTLETGLEGATLSFTWCFEGLSDQRTRLTQRIVLTGNDAAAYAQQVAASFDVNLQGGMEKIAATIAMAAARAKVGNRQRGVTSRLTCAAPDAARAGER